MQQLGDVAAAQADFERSLERQPLADRTKREYGGVTSACSSSSSPAATDGTQTRSQTALRVITLPATFVAG